MHTFNECVPLCELNLLFSLFFSLQCPVLSQQEKRIFGGFPLVFNRLRMITSVKNCAEQQAIFPAKGRAFSAGVESVHPIRVSDNREACLNFRDYLRF